MEFTYHHTKSIQCHHPRLSLHFFIFLFELLRIHHHLAEVDLLQSFLFI